MAKEREGKSVKKKYCKLCLEKVGMIDYKDEKRLGRFVTDRGKIVPRRVSGACARHQKQLTVAIKRALGDSARTVAISSTKSMTGHLLGATGALEFAICVLVIQRGIIPPTINQFQQDPECDLDCAPNRAVERRVDLALSNSFGFGGHNVCLAVRRFPS